MCPKAKIHGTLSINWHRCKPAQQLITRQQCSLVDWKHRANKSVLQVYGHFGSKTLRTQNISALCVWCRSVSHFCTGARHQCRSTSDSSALKCIRHFGSRIKMGLRFECVTNVDPLYIRYSDGMEVLGKRLTKVVSD